MVYSSPSQATRAQHIVAAVSDRSVTEVRQVNLPGQCRRTGFPIGGRTTSPSNHGWGFPIRCVGPALRGACGNPGTPPYCSGWLIIILGVAQHRDTMPGICPRMRAARNWSPTQNCASGSSISPAIGQSALLGNPSAAQKASGTVPNIPRRRSCAAGGGAWGVRARRWMLRWRRLRVAWGGLNVGYRADGTVQAD
jgi:hypothetical protein